MKTLCKNLLWAALVLAGSLSLGACSDDDNDGGGNGNADIDTEEQAIVAENEFARIASVLAQPTELGRDWASQTLEPAVGRPVEGNTSVHMVAVADEAETQTAEKYWPFPTYGDLLFGVR